MNTCLGKSFSFGLLCVSSVNVYQICVCTSFPLGIKDGMWDVNVLIPDYCFSIYFVIDFFIKEMFHFCFKEL